MNDIIIIGAGPIGLYAGILAALHDLKGIIIESQEEVGGQLSALYPEKDMIDLPGFKKITAKEYIDVLFDQYNSNENKLAIHLSETITQIEKVEDYYVVKTNKDTYETKTILIATGMGAFTPRKIGLPNESQFKNIIYSIKNKDQYANKKFAILGGGDSAVDWGLMLEPICEQVSVVHRRNEFRAQSLSVEKLKASSANVLTPYQVNELIGDGDQLKSIVLSNVETNETKTIDVDVLFVNYGMVPSPNTFPVEKIGNNIKVYDYYQTSLENVFAIGNIIQYNGKVKNVTSGLGEAVIAITKIDQIINPNKNIPVHF